MKRSFETFSRGNEDLCDIHSFTKQMFQISQINYTLEVPAFLCWLQQRPTTTPHLQTLQLFKLRWNKCCRSVQYVTISQVNHLTISQPQAGHFNSSVLPSLHPKTDKIMFPLFINYADNFHRWMILKSMRNSAQAPSNTSAEIAKVIIILVYATNRSKEETGNNRVILLCLGETISRIQKLGKTDLMSCGQRVGENGRIDFKSSKCLILANKSINEFLQLILALYWVNIPQKSSGPLIARRILKTNGQQLSCNKKGAMNRHRNKQEEDDSLIFFIKWK